MTAAVRSIQNQLSAGQQRPPRFKDRSFPMISATSTVTVSTSCLQTTCQRFALLQAFDISPYGVFSHCQSFLPGFSLGDATRQRRHYSDVTPFFGGLKVDNKMGHILITPLSQWSLSSHHFLHGHFITDIGRTRKLSDALFEAFDYLLLVARI